MNSTVSLESFLLLITKNSANGVKTLEEIR